MGRIACDGDNRSSENSLSKSSRAGSIGMPRRELPTGSILRRGGTEAERGSRISITSSNGFSDVDQSERTEWEILIIYIESNKDKNTFAQKFHRDRLSFTINQAKTNILNAHSLNHYICLQVVTISILKKGPLLCSAICSLAKLNSFVKRNF